MKTLHDLAEPKLDEDDDEETHDAPVCPDCGNRYFHRLESGSYTERHYADFTARDDYPDENWDDQDTDMFDSDPWRCFHCDLTCPDWLQDYIDERR